MGTSLEGTSNSPIEDAAKGITKGFLEWSSKAIADYINKLKNKELAFIQDEKTIKLVREIYNAGEVKFYDTYINDKELLFLAKMGITLRRLEENDEKDKLMNLRDKIYRQYDVNGLHIAQFVQNGILNRYIGILIERMTTLDKFQEDLLDLLQNIDKYVLFVEGLSRTRDMIQKAVTIVNAHNPSIFIVSGIGPAAEIVRESEDRLKEFLREYDLEKMSSGKKEILFFKKVLSF
ncbi:MAG: hypothetical protein J7J15_00520 [Candidatus Aenigmarchaeota archaeon]|nr:hypothetical protein [Candidatus Aenigmarchaeota archaeon]